jgi:hypothetical protein
MLVVLDAVGVSMSISTFLGGGVSKDEGVRSASGGDTNLPVTAFLASGVLGPAITLPRGVPVPLPRLGAVGGGVTSSSYPFTFLRSLNVMRDPDPEPDAVMCCGVLLTEAGNASGVTPTVSKCPRRAWVRTR